MSFIRARNLQAVPELNKLHFPLGGLFSAVPLLQLRSIFRLIRAEMTKLPRLKPSKFSGFYVTGGRHKSLQVCMR